MIGKLIVTCMDGALAWIRDPKRRSRTYASDVVDEVLKSSLSNLDYINSLLDMQTGKGGIWKYWDRKCERHIIEHNQSDNGLLCVGKSAGAKDTVRILWKLKDQLNYRKIALVTIDPHWIGRFGRGLEIPQFNPLRFHAWNVYQVSQSIMNGTVLTCGRSDAEIKNVHSPSTDHFSITDSGLSRVNLKQAIKYLIGE